MFISKVRKFYSFLLIAFVLNLPINHHHLPLLSAHYQPKTETFLRKNEDVTSSNNISSGHKDESIAILFAGPHKAASTTIEKYILEDYYDYLLQDNYVVPQGIPGSNGIGIKSHANIVDVLRNDRDSGSPHTWDVFEKILKESVESNKNVILASEAFDYVRKMDVGKIAKALQPWDRRRLVLNYRHFYEWYPSMYFQYFRKSDIVFPSFPKWFKRRLKTSISGESLEQYNISHYRHPQQTSFVLREYRHHFEDIVLLNTHNSTFELHEQLFCDAIPDCYTSCEYTKEEFSSHFNKGKTLHYYKLAVEARERGLMESHRHLRTGEYHEVVFLSKVADDARDFHENVHNQKLSDFPHKCDYSLQEALLDITLNEYREVTPYVKNADSTEEASIRSEFDAFKESKRADLLWCEVDNEEVLKMDEWIIFFSSY